jgi:hypothetical protein
MCKKNSYINKRLHDAGNQSHVSILEIVSNLPLQLKYFIN